MSTRIVISLALMSSAACTEATYSFFRLPTAPEGARSVLAVYGLSDGSSEIEAATIDGSTRFDRERAPVVEVVLSYYRASLDALELAPGPVPLAAATECGRRPLPPADRYFGRRLGDDSESFEALDAAPASLEPLRIHATCPCVAFRVAASINIGEAPEPRFLFGSSPDRAYVGYEEMSHELGPGLTEISATADSPPRYVGARAGDGTFWAAGVDRRLWRGTSWDALVAVTGTITEANIHQLIVPRDPGPEEVLLQSESSELYRYTPAGGLVALMTTTQGTPQRAAMVWLGPSRALISLEDGLGLYDYDGGNLTFGELQGGIGYVRGLGWAPGYGALMSTSSGRIYGRPDRDWIELTDDGTDLGSAFNVMIPFAGGFLAGGSGGVIAQHHPHAGFCRPAQVPLALQIKWLVPLGEGVLVAGYLDLPPGQTADNYLYWLTE